MRSWQETRLTAAVRRHDEKLFVKKDDFARMSVWRESYELRPYDVDGRVVYCLESAPHFIMTLTENWAMTGKPCEWGVEPILERLKFIDAWSNQSFISSEMEKENKKAEESQERERMNKFEAAAYESHAVFKKTFSDINVANMAKLDKRRKKGV